MAERSLSPWVLGDPSVRPEESLCAAPVALWAVSPHAPPKVYGNGRVPTPIIVPSRSAMLFGATWWITIY